VVNVADGYARNFLYPRKMAVPADKGALRNIEKLQAEIQRKELQARTDAEAVATRLQAKPIQITAKAGRDTGKLFGSVTSSDIAAAIQAQMGEQVDRKKVELTEPIRSLGEFNVPIRLYGIVTAHVKVNVTTEPA
jgi:large subunit ribosomal protein L9